MTLLPVEARVLSICCVNGGLWSMLLSSRRSSDHHELGVLYEDNDQPNVMSTLIDRTT